MKPRPSEAQPAKQRRRILLIDDDPTFQRSAQSFLQRRFAVQCARSLELAMSMLEQTAYSAILLDLEFHERLVTTEYDGFAALRWLKKNYPEIPVLVVSKTSDPKEITHALDAGAYHFVTKLFKATELANLIERAIDSARLRLIVEFERDANATAESEMVGDSEAMRKVKDTIQRIANSDLSVLITGETGTGKELVAREIHRQSKRKGEFRALNLATFNDDLQAAYLFGTTKSAYTQAVESTGYFELCDGGTLFLDEVADFSPRTQAMLLRVLQDGIFAKLGSQREIRCDVRIVAATNKPLTKMIEDSEFRSDLWYRLAGSELTIPPLRERGEDVLLIADHFLVGLIRGGRKHKLNEEARRALMRHDWPGNVRELQMCLKRTCREAKSTVIGAEDLKFSSLALASGKTSGAATVDRSDGVERWHDGLEREVESLWPYDHGRRVIDSAFRDASLKRAMALTGGNISEAARLLGVSRKTIYDWLEQG